MQPGDVIVRYNGEPVTSTRDLQSRVVVTSPGTTVPVVVVRAGEEVTLNVTVEELDLDNEASVEVAASPDELSEGFGMTLQDLTPQTAASLGVPAGTQGAVVSDVQRGSAAEGSGVQPGDVVLSVNRVDVTNATTAVRELNGVESGRTAFLLVQRGATRVFLQVRKE
jgi:serine protease Do